MKEQSINNPSNLELDMSNGTAVGMFLIGIAVGLYMPGLPSPVNILQPYIGLVLIVVGVILFIKGN